MPVHIDTRYCCVVAGSVNRKTTLGAFQSVALTSAVCPSPRCCLPPSTKQKKPDIYIPKNDPNQAGLSSKQKEVYRNVLLRDIDMVNGTGGGGNAGRTVILNIVMQLRKCCNHPYLFAGVEDRKLDPLGDHLIINCGKVRARACLCGFIISIDRANQWKVMRSECG